MTNSLYRNSAFSIDLANTKAGKKAIVQLNGFTNTHIKYVSVSQNFAPQNKKHKTTSVNHLILGIIGKPNPF